MKRCIKITDRAGVLDLVLLLGQRAQLSEWLARDVWTVQEGDDGSFEILCNAGRRMPGASFISALGKVVQVIDGHFEGFENGSEEPWVIVESIDSSFHLVHAEEGALATIRSKFSGVSEYDPPKSPWRRGKASSKESTEISVSPKPDCS